MTATSVDEHRQRVLATVDSIPPGALATYGQVASEAGLARRARLVGRLLATLGARSQIPWHRVVNARGTSSLTGAAAREQRRRLRAEGVRPGPGGRFDLTRFGWRP